MLNVYIYNYYSSYSYLDDVELNVKVPVVPADVPSPLIVDAVNQFFPIQQIKAKKNVISYL